MTIKDTFTPMADHLRSEYGVDGLLTTEQIKAGIGGLHVQNLLDEGQSYDSSVDTAGWKSLIGLNNKLALLPGKTITISFDVTWSGYDPGKQRFGIEYGLKFKNDPEVWAGAFYWPASTSGSAHVAKSFSLHQDTITGYDEGNLYVPNITGYITKITNPKIVINPMGGGNQA